MQITYFLRGHHMEKTNNKVLGFFPLLAVVVGSVVGAGIFNSPRDLGNIANPGPILLGWLITGIGVFSLVKVFQYLSNSRPELEGGMYSYAKEAFGDFVGFNSGYGYWWSALFGNLAYYVAIVKILSIYFPVIEENKLLALGIASLILWSYHMLIVSGVRTAGITNAVITIIKVLPLFVVLIVAITYFKPDLFSNMFSTTIKTLEDGQVVARESSIWNQINSSFNTMLWTFIGIEGAVVLSNKAKSQKDVAKVTLLGFLITISIYVLVSTLTMGVVPVEEILTSNSPLGTVLNNVIGKSGQYLLDFGFLFSVMGALLSWLLLAAEIPYIAASRDQVFPKSFAKQNKKVTPVFSLLITNLITQAVLILLFTMSETGRIDNSENAILQNIYFAVISLAVICILIPYVSSAFLGIKTAYKEKKYSNIIFSVLGIIFCIWVFTAMWKYATAAVIIYTSGIIVRFIAKKEKKQKFTVAEIATYLVMLILSIISIYFVANGSIVY